MKVADLMSTDLISVEPHQDIGIALALMYEFDVRRLPVIDAEAGKLLGIISDRDVRLAIDSPYLHSDDQAALSQLQAVLVGEVMSTDLVVIGPNASIGDAARRMLAHKINGMPVVRLSEQGDAQLVGMITTSDLLRYLADAEGEMKAEG